MLERRPRQAQEAHSVPVLVARSSFGGEVQIQLRGQMCDIAVERKWRGGDDDNTSGLTKGPKAHSCQLRAVHE
jgi:hypothetical protein